MRADLKFSALSLEECGIFLNFAPKTKVRGLISDGLEEEISL